MTTHAPSTHRQTTLRRVRPAAALAAAALAFGAFGATNASADVSFKVGTRMPAAGVPWGVTLGDLDQDGRPDIVAPSISGNSLNVALGRVGGAFAPLVTTPTGVPGGN